MTKRTDLQRPSKAQKLHQDMIKYRRAKRLGFLGLASTGILVMGTILLALFRFDLLWSWIAYFVEHTHPVFVLVGFVVFAVLVDRWIEFIGQWESSNASFADARLQYEEHTAKIEGGELSCALIEHQHGELSQSDAGHITLVDRDEP